MNTEIGFVLVTYNQGDHIVRLVNTLNRMFDHPPIACHHDFAKSEPPELPDNVQVVLPHIVTRWGSMTVVDATMQALRLLYEDGGPEWFVFLSAADYPIKSADAILRDLRRSPFDVHIHHVPIVYGRYSRPWEEQCHRRYCTVRRVILGHQIKIRHPWLTRKYLPFGPDLQCARVVVEHSEFSIY